MAPIAAAIISNIKTVQSLNDLTVDFPCLVGFPSVVIVDVSLFFATATVAEIVKQRQYGVFYGLDHVGHHVMLNSADIKK